MPRSRIKLLSNLHNHLWAILLVFLNIIAPFQTFAFTSLHQGGESSEGASTVSALAAGRTTLPCDVTPRGANDTLLLVVWYREDTPIYSYDTRVKGPLAHWSERAALGARAHFTPRVPSGLQLEDARESDAGEYRCRVDFKVSPTRNYRVVLNVVVLPSKPVIYDENGKEVQSFTGPYREGGHFQLTCVVSGGKPPPIVRWLREGHAVGVPGPSPARIRVTNVTRSELHVHYRCEATNTPLAPPVAATVQIEMHLKPLSVSIQSREQPLSAGRAAALTCQVTGARPPALITWWVDGVQVPPTEKQAQDSEDVNVTMSTLTYIPTMDHHGKTLICRAEHRTIPNSSIDSTLQLNVCYAPIVTLELGSNLNPRDIEEGDDVYFECKVKANPPAYKVVWEHNGIIMQHNQKAGVITGGAHLALQSVARQQAGRYSCTASNVEGDGRSQPVDLAVMYKPVCRDDLKSKYGVAKLEKVRVLCAVDSYPKPVSFAWFFNNTAQSLEVTKDKYTEEFNMSRSHLSYVPVTDMDYGTLLCWASNMAGRQPQPCVFTLHPAVRPDALANCTIDNQTRDSFEVNCVPGNDGGSKQIFQLEVWAEHDELQTNLSSVRPTFTLNALGAGRVLRLAVFAANAHGRSDPVRLTAITYEPEADTHTGPHSGLEMTSLVGIFIGALLTFAIFACIGTIAIRMKKKTADQYNVQSVKQHKVTLPTVHSQDRDSLPGVDEKNPDVVPLNKEAKYTGSYAPENRAPEPPPYAPPASHSAHSLHRIAALNSPKSEDGRVTEAMRPRTCARREVVTTRTPLLAAAQQESCV